MLLTPSVSGRPAEPDLRRGVGELGVSSGRQRGDVSGGVRVLGTDGEGRVVAPKEVDQYSLQ